MCSIGCMQGLPPRAQVGPHRAGVRGQPSHAPSTCMGQPPRSLGQESPSCSLGHGWSSSVRSLGCVPTQGHAGLCRARLECIGLIWAGTSFSWAVQFQFSPSTYTILTLAPDKVRIHKQQQTILVQPYINQNGGLNRSTNYKQHIGLHCISIFQVIIKTIKLLI